MQHVKTFVINLAKTTHSDSVLNYPLALLNACALELLRELLHFNYNIKTYKQIHGCTVGSPVSPVVVKHCMKKIEELAFYGTDTLPKNIFGRAREETRKKNRICAITRRARTCIF